MNSPIVLNLSIEVSLAQHREKVRAAWISLNTPSMQTPFRHNELLGLIFDRTARATVPPAAPGVSL